MVFGDVLERLFDQNRVGKHRHLETESNPKGASETAREDVREFEYGLSGNLTVGSGNTVGMYLLPRMLGAFRRGAPHVRIAMRISSSQGELLDALSWRDIDLALLESESEPKHRKGLSAARFAQDEIVLFVSPRHPLASRDAIAADDLLGVPILSRPEGSNTRLLIWRHLSDAGLDTEALDNPLEVGNTEALKQAVQADLGAGFASRFALRQEVQLGLLVVVPIRGIRISRALWMVWNDSASTPDRLERFKRFLAAEAPSHTETGSAR